MEDVHFDAATDQWSNIEKTSHWAKNSGLTLTLDM